MLFRLTRLQVCRSAVSTTPVNWPQHNSPPVSLNNVQVGLFTVTCVILNSGNEFCLVWSFCFVLLVLVVLVISPVSFQWFQSFGLIISSLTSCFLSLVIDCC